MPTFTDPGDGWNHAIPTSQIRLVLLQTNATVTVPFNGGQRKLTGVTVSVSTNGARIEESPGVYFVSKAVDPNDMPEAVSMGGAGIVVAFPDGERWVTVSGRAKGKCRKCGQK